MARGFVRAEDGPDSSKLLKSREEVNRPGKARDSKGTGSRQGNDFRRGREGKARKERKMRERPKDKSSSTRGLLRAAPANDAHTPLREDYLPTLDCG